MKLVGRIYIFHTTYTFFFFGGGGHCHDDSMFKDSPARAMKRRERVFSCPDSDLARRIWMATDEHKIVTLLSAGAHKTFFL